MGIAGAPPGVRSVVVERPDGALVAWLTVENPAKLNVLNRALIGQLTAAVEPLAGAPDLRAVVLTGAGTRAFIGGADIGEMAGLDPASARDFITALHRACAALRALPVPVIARIRGHCLGAGLEVAASCDLRLAAADARFAMPEVAVGVPSVIEACLLPGLIGWGQTRRLVLTGEAIDAAEALAHGLVERVVPVGELDAAIEAWLDAIVAAGPVAIRAQKALIRRWERMPIDAAIDAGIEAFAESYRGAEPKTFMTRFLTRPR
ncbi:MAG: enoyl-CoA hydratase [Alphaproteobacteria bacterium]|jgi:enoyl-CoA hydratase/carnithine racemase|nr:enoyl-CoA hydratase [Alphaproteobacteria bacterium]